MLGVESFEVKRVVGIVFVVYTIGGGSYLWLALA